MKPTASAITTKRTKDRGKKCKNSVLPIFEYSSGRWLCGLPLVMPMPIPVKSCCVPSVARMAGILNREINVPAIAPQARPVARASSTATTR